ncbi:MAG: glycosyltransferase family 4 protein [Patescibacteria group bacterium]|jgi:glycosyltransferase involved in cell wall biosynthesis
MANILILKFPFSSLYGGGEKHTIDLVDNLSNRGFKFYLVSTCSVLTREFVKRGWEQKRIWAGTEPVSKKSLALFFFSWPFIFINLLRILITYKIKYHIQIIYCLSLTEKVLLTLPARMFGIKVIWVEHLLIENWLLLSPLKYLYIFLSRYCLIITVVNAVKDQLIKLGVKEQNIKVIYNSVDLKKFTPHPTPLNDLYNEFKVGFVGRLNEEKGVKYLILAIAKLKEIIPQIKLIIVGEGDQKNSLKMLIKDRRIEDRVMFVGFQKDIPKWMANFDCLVLPATRRETFGIVVAEALASIKPVIVTNVGGLSEVVGDAGYIVEPHHSTGIADSLVAIYKNYSQALDKAKKGRKRVEEMFSLEKMIQEYEQTFKDLL